MTRGQKLLDFLHEQHYEFIFLLIVSHIANCIILRNYLLFTKTSSNNISKKRKMQFKMFYSDGPILTGGSVYVWETVRLYFLPLHFFEDRKSIS